MAQASRQKAPWHMAWRAPLARGTREGMFILVSTLAVYLLLSLLSYSPDDPGWSHTGRAGAVLNLGGVVGAWLADVLLYLFGYMAFVFPVMVAHAGWLLTRNADGGSGSRGDTLDGFHLSARAVGFLLTLSAGAGLATLHYQVGASLPADAGGVLGAVIGDNLEAMLSPLGATLLLLALFLSGFSLFTGLSWLAIMDAIGSGTLWLLSRVAVGARRLSEYRRARLARRQREAQVSVARKRKKERVVPRIEPLVAPAEPSVRAQKERQVPLFDLPTDASGLPPLGLLDEPPKSRHTISHAALEAMSRQVELKLRDFGIEVEVVAVHPGPVITRFELQPAPGVKVSRITNLSKDLARSLSTVSVRIVEVIAGKSVIGLEIPNEQRELVCLSEIVKSSSYDRDPAPLALALGKDIGGQPVVVDLARMPHLLVAGTTGSGKSVAINAMVLSILYKAKASDVRLIMIDPKMLELSVYEGIPHLLAPVVTDMAQASSALRWCVAEMERRYQIMSALGVRNITGYNRKLKEAADKGEKLRDPLFTPSEDNPQAPELERLPMIVVVVDELADLMMTTGKKVEQLIARLAQKARASGVHLILATQRPSVDVITGLIKANIPSRIAFQVSAKVDSRTVIDQMGAEALLGHGDMLYLGPGTSNLVRVHGAFVSDQEVHRVVNHLRKQGKPAYLEGILDGSGEDIGGFGAGAIAAQSCDAESDPLYDQAVHIVTDTRRASISGVQRRLKIGYNRAARMLEQMEGTGVVGPLQSNGAREVLAPPPPAG
ncbi:MAG: DNA translocase FtsK [Gammaproteobacteria bacterium]|nr:MAG: DNA translocase FtsK [Gammaproteobacteria bacterium]